MDKLDIDLEPLGISEILSRHRLVVPPNQRSYAWEKEHVDQLFSDWVVAFNARPKPYFWARLY